MAEIPALVASLQPLAAFWEPLSEQAGYMIVMDGPVKVDLFPIRGSRQIQPPWVPGADTLAAIDAHFWDWVLWLGSKSVRGERQLVVDELAKMHWFLLGPLCATTCPGSLSEAVASYRRARAEASEALGTIVDQELGRQVSEALRRHDVLHNLRVRYGEPAPCGLSAKPTQPPRIALPASSLGTAKDSGGIGTRV